MAFNGTADKGAELTRGPQPDGAAIEYSQSYQLSTFAKNSLGEGKITRPSHSPNQIPAPMMPPSALWKPRIGRIS